MLLAGRAGLADNEATSFGRAAADAFADKIGQRDQELVGALTEKIGQRDQELVGSLTEAVKALLKPDRVSMSSAGSTLAGKVCQFTRQHHASPMRPALSGLLISF